MFSELNALYPPWSVVFLYTIFGLIAGSFANALIYRIPRGETLLTRSHCITCEKEISWYDNVPVFSWIALGGKCRGCQTKISKKYPLVELFTAAMWGLIAYRFGSEVVPQPVVLGLFLLVTISVALVVIDIETLTLPNPLVLWFTIISAVSLLVEFVYTFLSSPQGVAASSWSPFVIALICGVIFGLFYFSLWFFSSGKWVGFGDVKLVPALGLVSGFFGVEAAILTFGLPYLLGAIPIIFLMVLGKTKRGTQIPFGPFLLAGFWVAILFYQPITDAYMKISGLQ